MENKKKLDPRKILCLIGIITGVIFTLLGISDSLYGPNTPKISLDLSRVDAYPSDLSRLYSGIILLKITHVLGKLLTAFGLFEICFFGIKLKELKEQSNKQR